MIRQRRAEDISSPAAVADQQQALNSVMGRLIAIGESYPELKADKLFLETQAGVKQFEENVRRARMIYNDTATKMNRMVRQWPSSFVASFLHFDMKEYLKDRPDVMGYALKTYRAIGIEAVCEPVRGGTDGAMLSAKGLPCPNLGTGGGNFHGRYEYCCLEELEQAADLITEIAKAVTEGV